VIWTLKEKYMGLLGIKTLLLESIASPCTEKALMAHHVTMFMFAISNYAFLYVH
jgi:hypothetical protein